MNYEQDIRIDETALDIEWLDQPKLMMRYGRYAAEMQLTLNRAKENLDLVKAELDQNIRNNPTLYGIGEDIKITEAVVKAAVLTSEEYKVANEKYLTANYEYEVIQVAVRAVSQRKDALENLVRLYGQQYFAGPKMPRDLTRERSDAEQRQRDAEEQQRRVDSGIGRKLQRTRQ